MNKETLIIHKALSDLKILNKRIDEKISSLHVVAAVKSSNAKVNGMTVEDWKKNALANWDSVKADIRRRDALKRAINQSNATTSITINGKTYTIAEAIDMKQYGVHYLERIVSKLKSQFAVANETVNTNNSRVEVEAATFAQNTVGGKDKVVQVSAESIETIRKTYYDQHKVEMVEAINSLKTIEEIQKEIDEFTSEVDSAISVSNAVTTITIEY